MEIMVACIYCCPVVPGVCGPVCSGSCKKKGCWGPCTVLLLLVNLYQTLHEKWLWDQDIDYNQSNHKNICLILKAQSPVSSPTGRAPRAEGCVNTLGLTRLVQPNGALTRLIEFGAFWLWCFITCQLKQDTLSLHWAPLPCMRSSRLSYVVSFGRNINWG